MENDGVIIRVTKHHIYINDVECTDDNFEEVFTNANIGEYEAKQLMNLILSRMKHKIKVRW